MTLNIYLSFILYICAAVFMPGPNNILLLSAVGQSGFKKCLSLLMGIWTGLFTVMTIAAAFCSVLTSLVPAVTPVFKYVGMAYILYLAFLTLKRKPVMDEGESEAPLTFRYGFMLQFLNVKVITLGLAAFPGYFLSYGSGIFYILLFSVTMTVCCAGGNLLWSFFGKVINTFYDRHYRIVNAIMAMLLVYCAVKIVL